MLKNWADRLFKWYCNQDYYPDIKGDLEEIYANHLEENKGMAQWKYLIDVALLFRISLIKPITQYPIIKDTGMFRNYFKISVRNLARHKMFTTINVIGLAIGLAGFLLVNEYIRFEKSYDSFHKDVDQIYRVSYVQVINGEDGDKDAMASYLTGSVLNDELPEIIQHTVSKKFEPMILKNGNVFFKEAGIISADSNFLKLFNYQLIQGSEETLFSEPNSVVLTRSRARAYFGDEDPLGKTLEVTTNYKATLKVTGIIEDLPDNTHYKFDMMISDKTLEGSHDYKNWSWNNYYVYIKTAPAVDVSTLDEKVYAATAKFIDGEDLDENNRTRLDIHPIKDIYLKSDFLYNPQTLGSEKAVTFLVIISIFIITIAWVNYVNLSTARAMDRAKEVGLRKVIGAFRKQLIIQFLCEALLINLIGAIIALTIAEISLPFFNELVDKVIIDHVWNHSPFLISLLIFSFGGTIASGFYPALVLSDFKPIAVLKGKFQNSKKGVALRRGLVITQFAASMILVAATFIIYFQINYMLGKDIGLSFDKVVNVLIPEDDYDDEEGRQAFLNHFNSFKETLRNHSAIETVGGTSNIPGGDESDINSTSSAVRMIGLSDRVEGTTYVQYTDDEFFEAIDMTFYAGNNFDRNIKRDTVSVIVNQSFLKRFNVADIKDLLGDKIQFGKKETNRKYTIIGIVNDINRTSLKKEVEPTVYLPWMNADNLVIELNDVNYLAGIEHLENTWSEFYPDSPLDITYLDQRFAALYDQDKRFGNTFLVFAMLAILVAILGLFGLSSFLSIQRSKEVGVRKVLGATKTQIVTIFYKDFFVLIGIAVLIGSPIVYFLMDSWLDNYAYRIEFPWWLLLIAGLLISVFALITVGYQTSKVASLDPAKTLKYE